MSVTNGGISIVADISTRVGEEPNATPKTAPLTYGDTPTSDSGLGKVTLLVGPHKIKYTRPRELLCEASSFFSAALGDSKEVLELPDHDPVAVYVLLWYLETGEALNHRFYEKQYRGIQVEIDQYWFQVLKVAHYVQVLPLVGVAYGQLRQLFHHKKPQRPSWKLIGELYRDDKVPGWIQQYVVEHTAWWMWKGSLACGPIFLRVGLGHETSRQFATAVSIRLSELVWPHYPKPKEHPLYDEELWAELRCLKECKAGDQEVEVEAVGFVECEDDECGDEDEGGIVPDVYIL